MLNLEDRLISLVSRYLRVTNTLHESPLTLTTTITFKDRPVFTHDLDLTPLLSIIEEKYNLTDDSR